MSKIKDKDTDKLLAESFNKERELRMRTPIQVWLYEDAPEELKIGSPDDADWLALVPPQYSNIYISWLERGSAFGCCTVRVFDRPNKPSDKIYIGYHA